MLVLSRKEGEGIYLNDNIKITVVEINRNQIKLGIDAPRDVSIVRDEIMDRVKFENRDSLASTKPDSVNLPEILKKLKSQKEP